MRLALDGGGGGVYVHVSVSVYVYFTWTGLQFVNLGVDYYTHVTHAGCHSDTSGCPCRPKMGPS